jgi:hypothetical protein
MPRSVAVFIFTLAKLLNKMNYEYSDAYWSDYKVFISLIEKIVKKNYSADSRAFELYKSPNALIENWQETVESGKDYHFTLFEWDDEISVRELIENILNNEQIKQLEYFYTDFNARVNKIDSEFRSITFDDFERPHCKNWWEKRILKGGEDEYKEHIKQFYSIDLDELNHN